MTNDQTVTQAALEAFAKETFKHGHSEGWSGNQGRRDVQHVDAEKGWQCYVSNGALAKTLERHHLTAHSGEGRVLPGLENLLLYHETGGHDGDGSSSALVRARTELDSIKSGECRGNGAGEPYPGCYADLHRRRVTTLAKLGLMLTDMARGEVPDKDVYDPDELYAEVLMALAIEDAEDVEIALEEARDHPEGDCMSSLAAPQGEVERLREALAKRTFLTCVSGDGPTPYLKVHFNNLFDAHAAQDELLQRKS